MHEPYRQVLISLTLSIILILGLLFYRFVLRKKMNLFPLLILVSLLPLFSIARQGTYEAGDLTLHSVFLQSFFENLRDGLLTPQWAGGLCAGYGCPVFLFEYITPFYIGSLFHLLGFTYLDSMKLFLGASFIISGITMYIFIKDEYGKTSAFVGSLLYLFAPIHLMEMHFRVSVGTHAAFMFIPLSFLFAKKSLEGKRLFIILGALNFLLLILSHSSIAFVIVPASLIYAFIKKKSMKQMIYPFLSLLLGGGLIAYYVLPALFELKYTWYSQSIKVINDFKPFTEYIYSPSRFGLLFQGNHGELRLIVGYTHLIIIVYTLYLLFKKKIKKSQKASVIFLLIFFFICFSLMLSFTKPLWNNIFFLRSFILPWRMLVPIAFATAYLGAIVTKNWNKKLLVVFCGFIILSTILNWGNRKMVPLDPNAYSNHWSLYTEYFEPNNSLYFDRYNNRIAHAPTLIHNKPKSHLEILSGRGEIREISRSQINHEYIVYAKTNMQLSENTFYFPGWEIIVDGKAISVDIKNKKQFGTLTFALPKGLHQVNAEFRDTPIRRLGKNISIISFLILLALIFLRVRNLPKSK